MVVSSPASTEQLRLMESLINGQEAELVAIDELPNLDKPQDYAGAQVAVPQATG